MKRIQISICICLILFSFNSVSQEKPSQNEGYFVSTDGKLYWKGGSPLYLFVSENPDGSDIQRLTSEKNKEYTNPMYLDTEGINFIRSNWAVDKDGNYASPKQEIMFEIHNDGIAPSSSVDFSGASKYVSNDEVFYGKNLTVTANARDQVSGVRSILFSSNNSDYKQYSEPLVFPSDEDYSINFYAVDNVGNSESPLSFDFKIDVTSPITKHNLVGDQLSEVVSPRTTIDLTATDSRSGVKSIFYKIDDGLTKVFNGPISLQRLSEGEHTLTYFSSDNVDNKEEDKTYTFYVDRSAPEVIAVIEGDQFESGNNIFTSTRTKLKLESTDNKAGVQSISYSIDGENEQTYSEPFTLPEASGNHGVSFFGTDKVNNDFKSLLDKSSMGNKVLSVDMTPPVIKNYFEGDMCVSRDTTFISSRTNINLSAEDAESGVKEITYSVNGGARQTYAGPFNLDNEGHYIINFYGLDQVNNEASSSFSFVIDNTGPAIETILSMEPVGSISLEELEASLPVYSSGLKLYLGATDGIVDTDAIYYSINDGKEIKYTQPVSISQKGITSFKVRALDRLGNESKSEDSQVFIK